MPETLKGQIERVTYHNPENGFAVLKVKVKGREDLVAVLGKLTAVTPGEYLEASGNWVVDREHGLQFKADEIRTTHPASTEGIERYLASGAVRSIGPQLASKIVKLFGARTLDIIGNEPSFLLDIRGIGPRKLQRIRQSWKEQQGVREIMLFLGQHGISSSRSVRIYRTYGGQAIGVIKANPYQLAADIRGIGFKTADELAKKLGLPPDSPHRARAAVRHALQELTTEGHVAYPRAGVVERTSRLVEIDPSIIEAAVEHELARGAVIKEMVEGDEWLYLAALYRAEVGVAESISRLSLGERHPFPAGIDVDAALEKVEARLKIELAAAQREAIRQACRSNVVVITGGPGVGKTTLVRALLEVFDGHGLECVLAAPTGRAAKRLAEATGRQAKTVHRLLEFDPSGGGGTSGAKGDGKGDGGFKKNAERPLKGDVFILDETSMVDIVLANQLLRAVPSGACLVLVGDVDQLPSVGPGSVLGDIIASGSVPVVRLTEIFRQAGESRIVVAAYQVNQGEVPQFPSQGSAEELTDFYFIEAEEPEDIEDRIVRLVRDRIPARFGFDARTEIQVLSPMNRSRLGARGLNQLLQTTLNPPAKQGEIERFGWTFRVGDRVIQTENNYDRDVFNGDMGVIERIDQVEQEVVVSFEGRLVEYDFGDLDELSLAYVLTIHKSQGSEYPCVIIPLHTQHYLMLQRNLIYTAITRGKRLVVLVGSKRALRLAVTRQDTGRRFTALRRRLTKLETQTRSSLIESATVEG